MRAKPETITFRAFNTLNQKFRDTSIGSVHPTDTTDIDSCCMVFHPGMTSAPKECEEKLKKNPIIRLARSKYRINMKR